MGFTATLQFGFIYNFPLWQIGIALIILFLAAEEAGYRIGLRRFRLVGPDDAEAGGGGIVQTSLFAVLGLILAFTYSAAVDRHEALRHTIVQEANALGTAYLRADMISEPTRSELKQALYKYAVTRLPDVSQIRTDKQRVKVLRDSLAAQQKLWPLTRRAVAAKECGPTAFGLIASINDVLDQHTNRFDAITHKLPPAALYFLMLIAMAALAITGFSAGLQGRIGRWRTAGFAFLLAGLLLLIMDFDRPTGGLIKPQRSSLESTIADMRADLA
jgi:hypothetical protein